MLVRKRLTQAHKPESFPLSWSTVLLKDKDPLMAHEQNCSRSINFWNFLAIVSAKCIRSCFLSLHAIAAKTSGPEHRSHIYKGHDSNTFDLLPGKNGLLLHEMWMFVYTFR